MDFIYTLPWAGQAFFFLLFVYWGYVLWRKRRRAEQEYRDAVYEPDLQLGEDSWCWSSSPPEVDLPVEQGDGRSCLHLRSKPSFNDYVFGIIRLGLAGLTIWWLVANLFKESGEMVAPPGLMAAAFIAFAVTAIGFCAADAPITSIIRRRERLILVTRFAVFFHRKQVFQAKRAQGLVIEGSVQRLFEMNTDQLDRYPDFNLFMGRRFLPSKDRKFYNLNEIACLLAHLPRCIKGLIGLLLNL